MTAPAISTAVGRIQTALIHLALVDAVLANVARYRLPQRARLMRVAASCRAKDAGLADCKIMLEAAGVNLLAAGMDLGAVAAGTYVEAVLTPAALADSVDKETEITVDVDTCTAVNTASDVTIQIDYLPED